MTEPLSDQPKRPLLARAGIGLLKAFWSVVRFAMRTAWRAVAAVIGSTWRRLRRRDPGPTATEPDPG